MLLDYIRLSRAGFPGFPSHVSRQVSANISVTWEPDGILAYHRSITIHS